MVPEILGCGDADIYESNKITNRKVSTITSIDFYVLGEVASEACNTMATTSSSSRTNERLSKSNL